MNVIEIKSHSFKQSARAVEQSPPTRGDYLRRFLLWTGLLMDTSTTNNDRWNGGFLFVIALLFGTIFAGFIVLLAIGGIFYLDIKEDWRGTEAWRQKQIYDAMQTQTRKCEQMLADKKILIETVKASNRPIPANLSTVEDCRVNLPAQDAH